MLLVLTLLAVAATVVLWLTRPVASAHEPERVFRVGQEWRFVGRSTDPNPTLVIVRVDTLPGAGEVVHVSVRGVRVRNALAAAGYVEGVAHLPFTPAALQRSVTTLVAQSVKLPDFEAGYGEWHRAEGGAFTISVREALDLVEQAVK